MPELGIVTPFLSNSMSEFIQNGNTKVPISAKIGVLVQKLIYKIWNFPKGSTSSLALQIFEIILKSKNPKKIDMQNQKFCSIRFNQILKVYHMQQNMEVLRNCKCSLNFQSRSGIVD